MNKIVIYPGRFQPMLSHHAEVFKQLQSQFPDAQVYMGTSDRVELPKSPFNFKEKQLIATAHGLPANRVLAVNRPYHQEDYAKYFDPAETIIIFAVGEKDMNRFPFNNVDASTGLDMAVRGEARPKYYQKINILKTDPKPMSERGYITLAPTIKIGDEVASASAFRDALKAAPDAESAKQIYTKQFGTYDNKVFNLIYNKIARADMSEQINILRKLAGLTVQEAAPVDFSGADAKTAKFLPPNESSAKMSIANRFPKGADVNDPKVKQEQFVQALMRSPGSLLAEISERLDPKDANSLAVDQKISDIVQLMNQKDISVTALPADLKQFVLEIAINAVKNMELKAGDDSPAYSDMDDEDEFEKESVDLSNIRGDYGIEEDDTGYQDRYAVKNGKAVKDNPKIGGDKKQPYHVYEDSPEDAVRKHAKKEAMSYNSKIKQITHPATQKSYDDMYARRREREAEAEKEKEAVNPGIAKMAHQDGFTKGATMSSGATHEKAHKIDNWHTRHGGAYKQHFVKGFEAGRMEKINLDKKQHNINSKLQKDGSVKPGKQRINNSTEAKQEEAVGFSPVMKEAISYNSKIKQITHPATQKSYDDMYARRREREAEAEKEKEDEFDQEVKHGNKGRTTEGFSSEADQVLAQVGSGELDAYDVMTRPQSPAQAKAAEIIQSMYDDAVIDHRLHPDDDFEKILDIVAYQLASDYVHSDAELGKSTTDNAIEKTAGNALESAMAELRKLAGLR